MTREERLNKISDRVAQSYEGMGYQIIKIDGEFLLDEIKRLEAENDKLENLVLRKSAALANDYKENQTLQKENAELRGAHEQKNMDLQHWRSQLYSIRSKLDVAVAELKILTEKRGLATDTLKELA
jgi:hypothetical protein